VELGATASDDVDGDISGAIAIDASAVNTTTTGSYSVTYDVSDSAGNAATQVVRTVNVVEPDDTPPVITLIGDNPQTIVVGNAYVELGATASDDVDGDISSDIVIDASEVNTATLGSYTVKYDVSDSAGNAATQVTRTVNVVWIQVDVTPNPVTTSVGGVLNSSANLSGGQNLIGTITFKLYPPSDAACQGAPAYEESMTVTGAATYDTDSSYVSNIVGTWRWTADYSSTDNNLAVSSGCDEALVTVISANPGTGDSILYLPAVTALGKSPAGSVRTAQSKRVVLTFMPVLRR
jgi:hypothetical protein